MYDICSYYILSKKYLQERKKNLENVYVQEKRRNQNIYIQQGSN